MGAHVYLQVGAGVRYTCIRSEALDIKEPPAISEEARGIESDRAGPGGYGECNVN